MLQLKQNDGENPYYHPTNQRDHRWEPGVLGGENQSH